VCYNCDGTGHKANSCPKKTGSSKSVGGKGKPQGKFTDNCTHCGKKGHKAETCWEKSENAGKMPQWLKDKRAGRETGAVATDGDDNNDYELVICSVNHGYMKSFPKSMGLLADPNIFIADSAATVHSTPYEQGMSNIKSAGVADTITVGNGAKARAKSIGDLRGTICDKYGNKLEAATLRDVTVLPDGKFNTCFRLLRCCLVVGVSMGTSPPSGCPTAATKFVSTLPFLYFRGVHQARL
jgi:hypothetical protein